MNQRLKSASTWNRNYIDLSSFVKTVTSQHGEDGLIEAIFNHCPPKNKWCVDVGAADGYNLSNTWSLIQKGWKSVQIEATYETLRDGKLFSGYRKIVENYKGNPNVYPVHKKVGKDDLDQILTQYLVPYDLDFMNIDIDSYDAEVWKNLKNYRPNLLVIECNEAIVSLDKVYYNVGDPKNAASVGFLNWIAEEKGYDFLCAEVCNAFYIEKKFGKELLK